MKALVVSRSSPGGVVLREVDEPEPDRHEAVVAVRAISLNRGEVRGLASAEEGARHGWDLAGVVVHAAASGEGPSEGARVVGVLRTGAWGERVAVPVDALGELPPAVSFAAASTLPVAGLTALRTLRIAGLLLGRRVLVTGAAGGVGRFAIQLADQSGANVTALVGRPERGEGLRELGATSVAVDLDDGAEYDVILESVGGAVLGRALEAVRADGIVISFGNSSGEPTSFDPVPFFRRHGNRLFGFLVFEDVARGAPAGPDLAYLARLVARGRLDPQIALETGWEDPGPAFEALMARRVDGKAVLLLPE